MARQIITECRDFIHLRFCASPLILSLGTSKWNERLTFIWKENFGSPILFLFSTSKTLVMLFLFQEWFDMRNVTVIFVCHSSSCTDTSLSALLVILSQVFESTFLDSSLQALFSPVHLFPPHFSLPVIFTQTCLSTTLCEQSVLSTVTLSCQWYAQLSNQQFSPQLLCAFHFTWNKYRIYERLHFCVKLWKKKNQTKCNIMH